MAKQYLIINTCGTSILTNPARDNSDLWGILTQYSNATKEDDIPVEKYNKVKQHWDNLLNEWLNKNESDAKKGSAELNCLLTWQRKKQIKNEDCICYLVYTDTVFGELAAMLIEEWLKQNQYLSVHLQKINSLNTSNINTFESGLSNLVRWSYEIKDYYSNLQTIFNTAGGFKSFSGFMQTLGTFIADETIYKFEGGDEVLEIPRLPIIWSELESIKQHFDDYHKIALGIEIDSYSHLNSLWIKNKHFTPWGQLAWENAKQQLYTEKVYSLVYDKIKEGKDFRGSIKNLSADRIKQINERLDDLVIYKMSNGLNNPRRLDYKKVRGTQAYSNECDAWADQDAKRLFCNEKGNIIIVEKLDKALH